MHDFDLTVSNGLVLVLVLLVLLVLAYLVYRSDLRRLGGWLLGLRAAVLLLAVALLMAPILALTVKSQRKPLVAVLVDDSESMRLTDGDTARSAIARQLLNGRALADLKNRARVAYYRFSDALSPMADGEALAWDGRATDLAGALDGLRKETAGDGLACVVLISDGGQNLGGRPERAAADLGAPVLAVGVGDPVAPKDAAVASAVIDPLGYVGRSLALHVRVRASGFDKDQTLLRVALDGREVLSRPIALLDGEQTFDFELRPERAGRQAYEVSIAPQPGERTVENNRVVVSTDVLESRVRLLLLSGSPSPDLAYLRRMLSADQNLELTPVVHALSTGWAHEVQAALHDLDHLDVVILLNVPEADLAGAPEDQLIAFVKRGGALLAIGGDASFDARYALSPLSGVLPLRFEKAGKTFEEGAFEVSLPEGARRHPVMRLSDDPLADQEAWAALPPLLAYNRVAGASEGATVLLQHGSERVDGGPMPLVAVMRAERGKTMAVACRTFWRFGLMMWGIGKTDALSQAFWKNAVRWLVTRDDMSRVRVTTDRASYRSGEPVTAYAQVFDALMQPERGARVQAVIADSSGTREVPLRDAGDGRYVGRLGGLTQGDYAFRVRATTPDGLSNEGTGHFTVGRYSLEYDSVRMNADLLSAVAAHSGGEYVSPAALPDSLAALKLLPEPVAEHYKLRLWGYRWPLVALVGLLVVEWIVRRRRGMI